MQALKKNDRYFELSQTPSGKSLRLMQGWTISHMQEIDQTLIKAGLYKTADLKDLSIDCSALTEFDSAGALLLLKLKKIHSASYQGLDQSYAPLVNRIEKSHIKASIPPEDGGFISNQLVEIGQKSTEFIQDSILLLSFFGEILVTLFKALLKPTQLRWAALSHHMKIMGYDALPIVGMMTFLVGIVIAYQGAGQLQKFGADIYTVNLVGIGTLRELGILLTAIILAGRTGSSITAQIGTMAVNEEIDALKIMGVNPYEILVIPRILALVLIFPLLTFFADILALIGGAIGCNILLGINSDQFIAQIKEAVPLMAFWVGLMKAPVFAFIIGLVGCFEGLKVKGSAESVGIHTTASVVKSIFIIIVFDAIFSIVLVYFDI